MDQTKLNQALLDLESALTNDGGWATNQSIMFKTDVNGKGIFWAGRDYTKQLVLMEDNIFSTENLDVAKNKGFKVGGLDVLTQSALGSSVTESNLKTLGRLRGLIVDGSMSINQYVYYDAGSDRLGIGTDQPNGQVSIAEDGIEIVLGAEDASKAYIGTYGSHALHIKTDNQDRVVVEAGGNVRITNDTKIAGKLAVGVSNPDAQVDLHVRGPIKFNNALHINGTEAPQGGNYNQGDICWNTKARQKSYIGWVCIQAGNPGIWAPFGEIR
jgi:hypothetical protein|tara:strand:+ start:1578 stop:2387 length:810 start_codon:yes stop_codon:yes gene_type:complete